MKETLLTKIKDLKGSSIGARVSEKVLPMKEQIVEKSNNLSSKLNVLKNEIKNIAK
jgi:hypothetical protein